MLQSLRVERPCTHQDARDRSRVLRFVRAAHGWPAPASVAHPGTALPASRRLRPLRMSLSSFSLLTVLTGVSLGNVGDKSELESICESGSAGSSNVCAS